MSSPDINIRRSTMKASLWRHLQTETTWRTEALQKQEKEQNNSNNSKTTQDCTRVLSNIHDQTPDQSMKNRSPCRSLYCNDVRSTQPVLPWFGQGPKTRDSGDLFPLSAKAGTCLQTAGVSDFLCLLVPASVRNSSE